MRRNVTMTIGLVATCVIMCGDGGTKSCDNTGEDGNWCLMEPMDVRPYDGKYEVRVQIGTRKRDPSKVFCVFTSNVASAIGSGSLKVSVPDKYGGDITIAMPLIESKGCVLVECSEQKGIGKWLLERQAFLVPRSKLNAEIASLSVKL